MQKCHINISAKGYLARRSLLLWREEGDLQLPEEIGAARPMITRILQVRNVRYWVILGHGRVRIRQIRPQETARSVWTR